MLLPSRFQPPVRKAGAQPQIIPSLLTVDDLAALRRGTSGASEPSEWIPATSTWGAGANIRTRRKMIRRRRPASRRIRRRRASGGRNRSLRKISRRRRRAISAMASIGTRIRTLAQRWGKTALQCRHFEYLDTAGCKMPNLLTTTFCAFFFQDHGSGSVSHWPPQPKQSSLYHKVRKRCRFRGGFSSLLAGQSCRMQHQGP